MRNYLNVNSFKITLLNVYENNYVIQNKINLVRRVALFYIFAIPNV